MLVSDLSTPLHEQSTRASSLVIWMDVEQTKTCGVTQLEALADLLFRDMLTTMWAAGDDSLLYSADLGDQGVCGFNIRSFVPFSLCLNVCFPLDLRSFREIHFPASETHHLVDFRIDNFHDRDFRIRLYLPPISPLRGRVSTWMGLFGEHDSAPWIF